MCHGSVCFLCLNLCCFAPPALCCRLPGHRTLLIRLLLAAALFRGAVLGLRRAGLLVRLRRDAFHGARDRTGYGAGHARSGVGRRLPLLLGLALALGFIRRGELLAVERDLGDADRGE